MWIMWSGNHIGHHCVMAITAFITSQVGIAGATRIGEGCFLAQGRALPKALTIGE